MVADTRAGILWRRMHAELMFCALLPHERAGWPGAQLLCFLAIARLKAIPQLLIYESEDMQRQSEHAASWSTACCTMHLPEGAWQRQPLTFSVIC